ncbi:hypothetical protein [Novosphingobium sp.]|uniref:hypothetical protein n=1 Tax=Novosphingobium sp. TaxID=1874826 RepID=UPI00333E8A89
MTRLQILAGFLAGVALSAVALPVVAHAEVTGAATAALRYDDNVFALPSDDLPAGLERSDTVYSGNAEIDATFHPPGYKVDLLAEVNYEAYGRNTAYNNAGYAFQLTAGPTSERLLTVSGSLTARRALSSFASLGLPVRNVQTLIDAAPELAVKVAGEFVVVVDPVYTRSSNTAGLFDAYNYERYGGAVGIGWHTPLGNRIDLTFGERHTKGLGNRFIDLGEGVVNQPTNLRDRSIELKLRYQITPITSINASASYVWRRDSTVLAHNFSAPFGQVGVKFAPSDHALISANVGWRLESVDQLFVDSVRTNYANVTATVQVGERWRLSSRFDYSHRKFEADSLALVNSYSLGLIDRADHFCRAEAAVTYGLSSHFAVVANYSHEFRNSSYHFANYRENIAQISLIYSFGAHPEQLTNAMTGRGL